MSARGAGWRLARPRAALLGAALAGAALFATACSDSNAPGDVGSAPTPGCQDGTLPSQGLYRLCFPAQWNGDLVVYAHGYVSPYDPLAIQDNVVGGEPVSAIVNGLGFAFATTSYRANGLVVAPAVEDLVQLTTQVRALVRPDPVRTYVVGVSEGGLVAALTAERHPEILNGALVLCGPVGDFRAQLDHFGDFRVVFDYLFPGVLPGSVADVPPDAHTRWTTTYEPAIAAALQNDPARAGQLFAVTGAPTDPTDPATPLATATGILWYSLFATPNAAQVLGGQPFDNTARVYAGSSDDAALNAGVGRFTASPAALAAIQATLATTGQVPKPMILLHTTGDPIVPVTQPRQYLQKVRAAGIGDAQVSATEVTRYGHCTFTGPEVLSAFDALVARAGGRPTAARGAAARVAAMRTALNW